jgi:hypothetical protein
MLQRSIVALHAEIASMKRVLINIKPANPECCSATGAPPGLS